MQGGGVVVTVEDGAGAVSLALCPVATEDAAFLCANHESADGETTPSCPDGSAASTSGRLLPASLPTMTFSTQRLRDAHTLLGLQQGYIPG